MNKNHPQRLDPIISLIAPSHRTELWQNFYESIVTNLPFEVIFVTDKEPQKHELLVNQYFVDDDYKNRFDYPNHNFTWILSKVKPAHCWEIAYRRCRGEFIIWTADDFIYSPYALDNLYNMYRSFYDHRVIVACNCYQDGFSAKHEHVLPWDQNVQLTTSGLISKKAIEEAGGLADINFVSGHWDVDLQMRIMANGGRLLICPSAIAYEPHNQFHKIESNFAIDWKDELEYFTSLWRGSEIPANQRIVTTQNLWQSHETLKQRNKLFIGYKDENLLTVSQGNVGTSGKWS